MSGRAAIRDVSSCTCQPAPATGATRARRLSPALSPRRAGWEFGPPLDRHLGTSAHAIVTEQTRTRRTSEIGDSVNSRVNPVHAPVPSERRDAFSVRATRPSTRTAGASRHVRAVRIGRQAASRHELAQPRPVVTEQANTRRTSEVRTAMRTPLQTRSRTQWSPQIARPARFAAHDPNDRPT